MTRSECSSRRMICTRFRRKLSGEFSFTPHDDDFTRHVGRALKDLIKNVQPAEDVELSENDLDDMVSSFS